MDVKNAFLHGDLTEKVYMKPPPSYPHSSYKMCKIRRALYGLKQAPRVWFSKFSSTISSFRFTSSPYDSAIFRRSTQVGTILVLFYVDDMIIIGNDIEGIQDLKLFLHKHFEMKDLGFLNYFLGFEVSSNSDRYFLTQAKYSSDVIENFGLLKLKLLPLLSRLMLILLLMMARDSLIPLSIISW